MNQQNFHEIIKYNSLCYVSESRPFNNNVLINGADSYLQAYIGIENWVDFYLSNDDKGYRIDGYGYDEDDRLFFVYSMFYQGDYGETIEFDKIKSGIDALSSFAEALNNDSLLSDLDESEQSVFATLRDLKQKMQKCEPKFIFLTNLISPPSEGFEKEISSNYVVFDFSKMYQFHVSSTDVENVINIDLKEMNKGQGLDILMATETSDRLEGYLLKMPGRILAEIYEKYKVALLESNIRFYLQDKANTNKGILRTIRGDEKNGIDAEPEMFFSYNNGISATCSEIELSEDKKLIKVIGLQIVNGGQTTASVHQILNTSNDSFLDKVTVQMKLSLIKNVEGKEEIIRRIAEYANTQNPIKKSDLTSNNDFIAAIENLSKNTAPKSDIPGKVIPKWFFERKVGEYNNLQLNAKNSGRFDAFVTEFPKNQLINKTDFAKRAWAWGMPNKQGKKEVMPYVATKSAEVVYRKYIDTVEANNIVADLKYYKESIAKEIIYKKIYSKLADLGVSGYKSNVALYTMAWLSFKTLDKIDLLLIWDAQDVSNNLMNALEGMIPIVHKVILTPNEKGSEHYGKNIGEFSKKEECWGLLKKINIVFDNNIPEMSNQTLINPEQINNYNSQPYDTRDFWVEMMVWSAYKETWTDSERGMMSSVAKYLQLGKELSPKQIKFRDNILDKAVDEGFEFGKN